MHVHKHKHRLLRGKAQNTQNTSVAVRVGKDRLRRELVIVAGSAKCGAMVKSHVRLVRRLLYDAHIRSRQRRKVGVRLCFGRHDRGRCRLRHLLTVSCFRTERFEKCSRATRIEKD